MGFFTTSVTGLKTVVTAIGAGVGAWGVINLLEGYGNDNPGAKSQGMKQLMLPLSEQLLYLCFLVFSVNLRGICCWSRESGQVTQIT